MKKINVFGLSKKKKEETRALLSPQSGKIVNLSEVPDEVFSQRVLGDGFAVCPEEDAVFSPVSGTVIDVQDTRHAYGIETDDGIQVLVHIGIDTVSLNGEGFKAFVKNGDIIKAGDKIAEADNRLIKEHGLPLFTVVLITNPEETKDFSIDYKESVGGKTEVLSFYR
jgi:glucose-specific phosphotransferase system IIA component